MTAWLWACEILRQALQYLGVAVVAFAVDYGAYAALLRSDVSPLAAAPVGFVLGLCCNYILAIRFVFTERRIARRRTEFLYFGVIGLIGMGLNEIIIAIGYEWLHFSAYLSKFIAAGLVFGFNFTARRTLLFSVNTVHE